MVVAVLSVAGCGGATDDRPPKWSLISATTRRGGVDLHDRETGYYNLVNGFYVYPGNPGDSAVITLMNAQGSTRMPPDVPMSEADIALIASWISAGAPNN